MNRNRKRIPLTYEMAVELLEYDELCDCLRWKVRRGGSANVGAVAGHITNHGYNRILINGIRYLGHRVAWLLHYGRWPADQLDHIDGNRASLRIENLREVDQQGNSLNQKLRVNNTSGVPGVCWYKAYDKWQVRINARGRCINIGYFASKRKAIQARRAAEKKYGYSESHGLDAEMRQILYGDTKTK
jgi:hypothetical protein